ncbi:MAG: hypothetical protein IJ741_06465 [Schwartzia sp.]|nr:hypothetical protein [Schwartzia sp. (in: firmicutes)]
MMKLESELNCENAQELSRLILANPKKRVVAWISSDGINDDYSSYVGNISCPSIQTIAYTKLVEPEHYIEKQGDDLDDCIAYYGWDADDWTDEELARKAAQIPWEDVIAVSVSAT